MLDNNSTIRAFFAIDLPRDRKEWIAKELIEKLKQEPHFKNVHWTALENLHITLQFMPALKLMDIEKLSRLVKIELEQASSFILDLGALEYFPSEKHPKIISMQVCAPKNELTNLSERLGAALTQMDYDIEKRPFRAHLTLGKTRDYHSVMALSDIKLSSAESFIVKGITLFESRPSKTGSVYLSVANFQF